MCSPWGNSRIAESQPVLTLCPRRPSAFLQPQRSSQATVELTWHWVLVMILKPPEEAIHCWEDLTPVPESFWSHCYIFDPGILEGNICQKPPGVSCEDATRTNVYHVSQAEVTALALEGEVSLRGGVRHV